MPQGNAAVPESSRTSSDARAMTGQGVPPVPPHEILDKIASKWAIQIVVAAAGGPVKFSELERLVEGISRRMLTLTLRNLERDGLLERKVYATVPPKVEYTATPMALELREAMLTLTDWSIRHSASVARARELYDARHTV
ncbi:winged helix-turn-helix transcriptional regulator [Nonomuraea rhizosphaerae]|uniref:winged helix-turn-helix transcriptional regulator n=1 Tax=Nonomuraea rhizosphaerae TaxID=2665663 RepID=UPI001C5FB185|nr:helix-turn-helix domain-containing protein [Nonomuraea rhizosphaerae]